MANNRLKAQWQKVDVGKQALGIWACLSLPSILVTLVLYFCPESDDDDDRESRVAASASDHVFSSSNASYTCYENLTVYHPIYLEVSMIEKRVS